MSDGHQRRKKDEKARKPGKNFLEFVVDQIENTGEITCRYMFGEYGVYSNKKQFGSICENNLFIKTTNADRALIRDVVEASAYPGAK